MPQIKENTPEQRTEAQRQKALLAADAERAKSDRAAPAWLEAKEWAYYTDQNIRVPLYRSFTDEELLDILRWEAEAVAGIPTKKDLFCVYREFIVLRFKNWPKALEAAGLRASRAERHAGFREAEERRLREKKREKKQLKAQRIQLQREAEARKRAQE